MLKIGDYNRLRVVKVVDFGMYLDGGEKGEILIPEKYIPQNTSVDDDIDVFVYADSQDRIIATTEKPYVTVNNFALLKCVDDTRFGAFFDWGLPSKHLLVPGSEQKFDIYAGQELVVYVYLDEKSDRVVGSTKLGKFTNQTTPNYEIGEEVDVFVADKFSLGYRAIINDAHMGAIYENEIFKRIEVGQKLKAFVKKVREDGKIDLALQKAGFEHTDEIEQLILDALEEEGGMIPISDKSSPEDIKERFQISKKAFKKAIGGLFKKRLIIIDPNKITLK